MFTGGPGIQCKWAWPSFCLTAFFRFGGLSALPGLPVLVWYINRFQIKPEERVLEAKFGSEYVDYRSSVRRWL